MRRNPYNRIRECRQVRGWRQQDLALKVGVTGPDIGKYERGVRVPSVPIAMRIAAALGRPVEDVFWGLRDEALEILATTPAPERADPPLTDAEGAPSP